MTVRSQNWTLVSDWRRPYTGSDPCVDLLAADQELSPGNFLKAFMHTARGTAIDTKDWQEEKLDQAFALDVVEMDMAVLI
jgi:hypothetical protein